MLKGISPLISPDILRALAAMGHGDYIALCDANCPAESFGRTGGALVLRADGISATELLRAILDIMPVDQSYPHPFLLGNKTKADAHIPTPIWDEFHLHTILGVRLRLNRKNGMIFAASSLMDMQSFKPVNVRCMGILPFARAWLNRKGE